MQTGYRVVVSALGWFAIILQYWLIASTRSGPDLVAWTINYFSFFTTIGNILVALAMTLPWLAPRSRLAQWLLRPSVRTVIVAYIIVVGLVYHLMLRNLYNPQGWRLACVIILHYVIPPLFIIDWLAFVQKRDLSWKILFGALALPVLYVAWTLVHGAVTGFYPYPFINVARFGYAQVLMTVGTMIAAFVCLVLGLVGIGRLSAGWALRRSDEQAEA
ncbi:MAG TPA: Pr6Pr family membrane protein [Xanthobacteraceae bacterium]|jgi:hypothetical protein|nr:Pr6Pr family membrane protein [Xanthobacteraceae bacterium]